MKPKQIVVITVTMTVFVWSVVMVAVGQTAAVAALAPALGLTVQQIVGVARSHTAPRPMASAADEGEDAR